MTELLTKKVETTPEKNKSFKYVVGAVAVFAALFAYHEAFKSKPNNQITDPTPYEQPQKCAQTWEMPGISHNNGDWIEGGVSEIEKTGEKTDAREVLTNWFDQIDNDSTTLDYMAESVHKAADKNIVAIDKKELINSDGCATDLAVNEANYVKDKLKSADISYGLAPTVGRNTFIDSRGEIENSVVTDERQSIVIDFHNGNFLYVLGVCGNIVTTSDVYIINETKKTTKNHETHKDEKTKLTEKSSSSSDYKQPGDGNEKDSGTGSKPKATVSTPAESTPPKVEVKTNTPSNTNNGVVTDQLLLLPKVLALITKLLC